MNYDEKAVEKTMNEIYSKSKHIGVFRELYQIAAGHMFSVDHETGLAVLLSYDYFPYFKSLYEKFTEFSKNANRIIELANDEISDKLEDTNVLKELVNAQILNATGKIKVSNLAQDLIRNITKYH